MFDSSGQFQHNLPANFIVEKIMPELPEVETICRGISPHMTGGTITRVIVRQPKLRWPVPVTIADNIINQKIRSIQRRAKYLLLHLEKGTIIIHLGMSGSLAVVNIGTPVRKHDHVDLYLESEIIVRFNDPRRFGSILWTDNDPGEHKLLSRLGPEPLSRDFTGKLLYQKSRGKTQAIKNFIMNNGIVVGVGNIYATEALFMAKIRPDRAAHGLVETEYTRLVDSIKKVLEHAIDCGGTTLRDFRQSNGKPGYFSIELSVYGKKGTSCKICHSQIESIKLGQRASAFCPKCQH